MLTKNNRELLKCIFSKLNNKCPDEYVGDIEIKSNSVNLTKDYICSDRNKLDEEIRRDLESFNDEKVLCIVLESPHNKEFEADGTPLGPARGITGTKLEKNLTDKLRKFNENNKGILNGRYKVILMNAIQYKCSLGVDTRYYRDRIWLNLWFNGLKGDFEDRIDNYNPDIVLNLCTRGNHENDPLYHSNIKADLKYIRIEFINEIDKNMIQDSYGNLYKKGSELYFCFNFIDGCKSKAKYIYPLWGFVDTSLCKQDNNFILLKGNHPSSAWFKNEFELISDRIKV
ncbi:hypothetical protein SAMN04488598_10730 [Halanaerobium congolense]|jgi:hypothetical protein|uniref:Uncharacterized protein n=1 Tax=Halanaerobium congolense TaxID=54121 RepID=A0A1H9ZRB0_9FIRM|nr:hypothetical protein [Halanaerobium congolense]PTX16357.1 hypothetical protein C7953_1071 [Halanaerobium congolense]SDF15974.1 hypothetical protein SAMN04488598_10730 [Halanaerobium congolense]SES84251.1 hypothetical protein SAMN04515652_10830 [Halanaerobium congolense]SFP45134.1 hypothetical protein SAMN04488596_12030 [Halanaerobium congolense]